MNSNTLEQLIPRRNELGLLLWQDAGKTMLPMGSTGSTMREVHKLTMRVHKPHHEVFDKLTMRVHRLTMRRSASSP